MIAKPSQGGAGEVASSTFSPVKRDGLVRVHRTDFFEARVVGNFDRTVLLTKGAPPLYFVYLCVVCPLYVTDKGSNVRAPVLAVKLCLAEVTCDIPHDGEDEVQEIAFNTVALTTGANISDILPTKAVLSMTSGGRIRRSCLNYGIFPVAMGKMLFCLGDTLKEVAMRCV